MALLILFGFVAGAATALSPCVLPVLPIALSAGATGGRRRPLGIVAGLAVSFTFATVALVYVISALGLPGRPAAQAGDLRPARLRHLADDPAAGGAARGLAEPLRGDRRRPAQRRRRRLLVRRCGRRQSRLRLRALRRPDPRRRDHRLGLAVVQHRPPRRGAQLRARLGRRPLLPDARRAPRDRAAVPPRQRLPGGDGRGDGRRGSGDARQLRRQISEQDRQQPAELPGQSLEVAGGHRQRRARRWRTCAAAPAARSAKRRPKRR